MVKWKFRFVWIDNAWCENLNIFFQGVSLVRKLAQSLLGGIVEAKTSSNVSQQVCIR